MVNSMPIVVDVLIFVFGTVAAVALLACLRTVFRSCSLSRRNNNVDDDTLQEPLLGDVDEDDPDGGEISIVFAEEGSSADEETGLFSDLSFSVDHGAAESSPNVSFPDLLNTPYRKKKGQVDAAISETPRGLSEIQEGITNDATPILTTPTAESRLPTKEEFGATGYLTKEEASLHEESSHEATDERIVNETTEEVNGCSSPNKLEEDAVLINNGEDKPDSEGETTEEDGPEKEGTHEISSTPKDSTTNHPNQPREASTQSDVEKKSLADNSPPAWEDLRAKVTTVATRLTEEDEPQDSHFDALRQKVAMLAEAIDQSTEEGDSEQAENLGSFFPTDPHAQAIQGPVKDIEKITVQTNEDEIVHCGEIISPSTSAYFHKDETSEKDSTTKDRSGEGLPFALGIGAGVVSASRKACYSPVRIIKRNANSSMVQETGSRSPQSESSSDTNESKTTELGIQILPSASSDIGVRSPAENSGLTICSTPSSEANPDTSTPSPPPHGPFGSPNLFPEINEKSVLDDSTGPAFVLDSSTP